MPDATIHIKGQGPLEAPSSKNLPTTSFGNYEFMVTGPNVEPMYGILPLKFNGGYLAADILFFAPAAFFNLREVFPQYQFDLDKSEIRYRKDDGQEWTIYKPTFTEVQRAKSVFKSQ